MRAAHRALFAALPLGEEDHSLVLSTAPDDTDEARAVLGRLGFHDTLRMLEAVRRWRAGLPRALRSARARELLEELLPALLRALAQQADPDLALARFDRLLGTLPGGVQILSLFSHNRALIDRLALVLGAAPGLAEHLAHAPQALEGLLAQPADLPADPAARLAHELGDVPGLEERLAVIRGFVRGEEFRLSLARIEGRMDVDAAGRARSALADAVIGVLIEPVWEEMRLRAGDIEGGGFAVMALGKAGGRAMMAGSDLDLMLIYDYAEGVVESSGPRRLAPPAYFHQLAQRFVAAMTAPGIEGPLYAVDMRLRPSGNKGPVAVSLASLRHYHRVEAWSWERMALVRARVIAGSEPLRGRLEAALVEALTRPVDPALLRRDGVQMRARMARDLPPFGRFDVKLRAGGLVEVEFIVQILVLIHAAGTPALLTPNSGEALDRLAAHGFLSPEDRDLLHRADRCFRIVQEVIRLMVAETSPRILPPPALELLKRELGPDVEGLIAYLCVRVRECFVRLIGDPDGA